MCCQFGKVGCAVERFGGVGRKVSGHKAGNTNAEQKTKIFKIAIEGKLKMQSRANERLHDQIIEEIKEMEHKKTEEALNLVKKENDLWRYRNEKEEAKKKAGSQDIFQKMREWLGHHQETSRTGQIGKRREVWEKTRVGWSQRRKRRCRRSLSCRKRSKALTWTLKATVSRQ